MSSKWERQAKRLIQKSVKIFENLDMNNRNKEMIVFSFIIGFSVFCRVCPFSLITIIALAIALLFVLMDFYVYVNKKAKEENKNEKTIEYSWGFIREKTNLLDFHSLVKYLTHKDFSFYKEYIEINQNRIIVLLFIFGDLIVAFKNLSMYYAGAYIALSIFTKFVFLGYIFMRETFLKILVDNKKTEENILDIFYTQINGLLSVFAVLFVMFFILSKYLIDIFFGDRYIQFQSSLPFVLLANIALVVAICAYTTSKHLDEVLTKKIFKIFSSIFFVIFVFMAINYVDTVTYFVIGASSLLSIFLYNFVIKRPEYISRTYNLTF
jgi:hypothetical protein